MNRAGYLSGTLENCVQMVQVLIHGPVIRYPDIFQGFHTKSENLLQESPFKYFLFINQDHLRILNFWRPELFF